MTRNHIAGARCCAAEGIAGAYRRRGSSRLKLVTVWVILRVCCRRSAGCAEIRYNLVPRILALGPHFCKREFPGITLNRSNPRWWFLRLLCEGFNGDSR
jgi:hypothetical protein